MSAYTKQEPSASDGATHAPVSSRQQTDLLESFERDGYIVMLDLFPKSLLDEWRLFSQRYWHEIFEKLFENGHAPFPSHCRTDDAGDRHYALGRGIKHGFREIVMRSPGRYELSLLHPFSSHHPPLDGLVPQLSRIVPPLLHTPSWDDLKICNLSLIVSTPGSTAQGWHADGGHISATEHLPCHVLNIFVPLVDVTAENGPTELRPGTHYHTRDLARQMLLAKARGALRPAVAPVLAQGDALLFDYRVLHRGRANVGRDESERRSLLCITVSQPWFRDLVNFPLRSIELKRVNGDSE